MLDRVAVAATTVILAAGEVTPFMDAVMVVNPAPTPVATPVFFPTLVIAGLVETQLTEMVMSAVAPSEYVAIAVRLEADPLTIVADAGVIAMLVSGAEVGGVTIVLPLLLVSLPPPQAVSIGMITTSKLMPCLPREMLNKLLKNILSLGFRFSGREILSTIPPARP
ncbi:MAG: hypothetical protein NUV63_13040 [Gallionella sp.]|nr:hypothetical protein [Gallionella sp.]